MSRGIVLALYQKFEETGAALLSAIAIYLDLGEHYFEKKRQLPFANKNAVIAADGSKIVART